MPVYEIALKDGEDFKWILAPSKKAVKKYAKKYKIGLDHTFPMSLVNYWTEAEIDALDGAVNSDGVLILQKVSIPY